MSSQLETTGRQSRGSQHVLDGPRQSFADELSWRDVDGDAEIAKRRDRLAGLQEHPLAERNDQADLLGDGKKGGWRQQAELGVVPADQGLHAGIVEAPGVYPRLEMQHELLLADGAAEIDFQTPALHDPVVHFGREEARGAAPVVLRLIEGNVGKADQFARFGGVRRAPGYADRGTDGDLRAFPDDRLGNGREELAGQLGGALGAQAGGDHHELVAADAGGETVFRGEQGKSLRHLGQNRVAGLMAEAVVDRLEAVEIDEKECRGVLLGKGRLQEPHHVKPVRQAGGGIVQRAELGVRMGVNQFGPGSGGRQRSAEGLAQQRRDDRRDQKTGDREDGQQTFRQQLAAGFGRPFENPALGSVNGGERDGTSARRSRGFEVATEFANEHGFAHLAQCLRGEALSEDEDRRRAVDRRHAGIVAGGDGGGGEQYRVAADRRDA